MKYQELQDEVKAALKAHDKPRVSILRQVHGEVKNIEVNERREITDADVDAMLKRVIKQTKEMGKVMGALTTATGGNFDKAAAAAELGKRLA